MAAPLRGEHTAPVKTTIWRIENRFASELSLAEIAEVSNVSRFNLSRAFGVATGNGTVEIGLPLKR